jgi:hypothetical protein
VSEYTLFQNVFCTRSVGPLPCARHPQILVLAVLHGLGAVGLEVVLAVVVASNPHIVGMDVVDVEALANGHGLEGVQCIGTVGNQQVLEVLAQLICGDAGRLLGNPVRVELLPIGAGLGVHGLQGLGRGNRSSGSGARCREGAIKGEVVESVFHGVFRVGGLRTFQN